MKKNRYLVTITEILNKYILYLVAFFLSQGMQMAFAQKGLVTNSWSQVVKNGKGSITILWCDIEPFIYVNKGRLTGVEYELMQGFPAFLKTTYNVDVHINWQKVSDFEKIYPAIQHSKENGLFGLSYFSITEERKKEVKFSPPYMPDLNIMVSSNSLPVYENSKDLLANLEHMKGYTMGNTTMREDMLRLQQQAPGMPLVSVSDDYEVMRQISASDHAIGYVPLSIYIVGLQKGIRIKRQKVLPVRREGFAAIYPRKSDWDEPVQAYFKSEQCKVLIEKLIRKHLGAEVSSIILEASAPDSLRSISADIELLTKEREIVTERLINTALQIERERILRNIIVAAVLISFIVIVILFRQFTTKKKHALLLQQHNEVIVKQKNEIELVNLKLQQKLVFAQLNPHLIFNSLTAVQHFVMLDDKKSANKYLTKLSKFIRHILQNAEQPMVLVTQEKSMIEQFLELEQARFEFKFDYKVTMSEKIAGEYIPAMLVFPFVEHTLYERVLRSRVLKEKGMLGVHFDFVEHTIIINIRDNSGMNDTPEPADDSISLAGEQIRLLNKSLDRKITIHTEQAVDDSFREMRIAIPDHITL